MKIEVAVILKPQGLKGELKVKPLVNNLSAVKNATHFYLGKDLQKVKVIASSFRNDFLYLFLENSKSIDDAETLRNVTLYLSKEDLQPKDNDEYLIDDLIGCAVVDEQGKKLADLESIEQYGAADVLFVRGEGRLWMVPFIHDLVKKVDIQNKTIVFDKALYWEIRTCD